MSTNTKIQWTDETWNPMIGCSKVSEGCRNCYAMHVAHVRAGNPAMQAKFGGTTKREGGKTNWTGKVNLSEEALLLPLKWKSPRRIFVNSMSDLFHESAPDEWIDRVFAVMALCPQHTFQVLTKRPARMRKYCATLGRHHSTDRVSLAAKLINPETGFSYQLTPSGWALPNVWLGTSVEDQETADERVAELLQTPAAVRFISAEPLLGPVDFTVLRRVPSDLDRTLAGFDRCKNFYTDALEGCNGVQMVDEICHEEAVNTRPRLDWVIVGGESGHGSRPCNVEWIRTIVGQCKAAGVACFVKQLGAHPYPGSLGSGRMPELALRDRKGGDPAEWPDGLLVRQFPAVTA